MGAAVDERAGVMPDAPIKGNEGEWIKSLVRGLGQGAGLPVAVILVWQLWGADIDAGNARSALKDAAIIKAWDAEAAKDAAEQALYEKRAAESEQTRIRDVEWTRKLKLEADKLAAGG